MYKHVSEDDFIQAFKDYGEGNRFSPEALSALYDWYEEGDLDIELDVIAICCDWEEMTLEEILRDYPDHEEEELLELLSLHTTVIELSNTYLVMSF